MKDDFRDRSHLTTIQGERFEDIPRRGRRLSLSEPEQILCWQCRADEGIETSMILEVVQAPRRSPSNKLTAGTKAGICVYCLARGKVTKLVG